MNILQIQIQNTFKHKNTIVKFKEGVNLLSDKNEGGKSLLLSMICFALYGTTALRGSASDYKDLKVNMIFKINNTIYIVDRATKDQLFELVFNENDQIAPEPKIIASGKAVVNEYIIKLLGYKLDVFYKINFSQQLEGDAYATSKKSERLDLINKINGIDEATALEKYIETKKKALKSEIKGLDMSAVVNNISFTHNSKLDEYTEEQLNLYSTQISALYSDLTRYENIITAFYMIPEEPVRSFQPLTFTDPNTNQTISVNEYLSLLLDHNKKIRDIEKQINTKQSYLDQYSIFTEKNGLTSFITEEEVEELEKIEENNKLFKQKKQLLEKGNITCPHCQTTFPLMYASLSSLESVVFIPILYNPNYPSIARNFLNNHLGTCLTYRQEVYDHTQELTLLKLLEWNISVSDADTYQRSEEEFQSKLKHYETVKKRFEDSYGLVDTLEVKELIVQIQNDIQNVSQQRTELETYLRSKSVYTSSQIAKKEVENIIEANKNKIEAYDILLTESKNYKLAVQNKCIPILNKKASLLVSKMTGGEHYSLTLSNTFELVLDSKPLSIYSGSTQVLANVAFRIALIEMYFKNTFPVFIGDEIDAFADPERAQHMHNAIEKLSKEGYQIILISHHKDLDNENFNIIELAKCKNK